MLDTDGNVINDDDHTTPRAKSRNLKQESKATNLAEKIEEQKRCSLILSQHDIYEVPPKK